MDEMIAALKHPYEATIRLQSRAVTTSEAYAIWFKCKFHLSISENTFSKSLHSAMEKREKSLLSKWGATMAAVYVEPRYQNLLTASDKDLAKTNLEKLYFLNNNNNMNDDIERCPTN